MAFEIERVDRAHVQPVVLLRCAPSRDLVWVKDPRLAMMLPELPWLRIALPGVADAVVIGEDWLKAALYDDVIVTEAVLPASPPVSWLTLRYAPSALQRMLVVSEAAGLLIQPYTLQTFKAALRAIHATMPLDEQPALQPGELEYGPTVDFAVQTNYAYLQWLEFPIQSLRQADLRVKWFGFLSFSMESHWGLADRYSGSSIVVSVGAQWYHLVCSDQYCGAAPCVRPEAFAQKALRNLKRSYGWFEAVKYYPGSTDREEEMVRMLQLGSPKPETVELGFSEKVVDIVNLCPKAKAMSRLTGRTTSEMQVFGWYKRLSSEFVPSFAESPALVYTVDAMQALCIEIAPRLDFLSTAKHIGQSDGEWVKHVVTTHAVLSIAAKSASKGGQPSLDGVVHTPASAMKKLDILQCSKRFQEADVALTEVMSSGSQMKVVKCALEQGIPYLTQFILGKRNVTGHRLWEELGPWRLTWGQTGSVEKKTWFHVRSGCSC